MRSSWNIACYIAADTAEEMTDETSDDDSSQASSSCEDPMVTSHVANDSKNHDNFHCHSEQTFLSQRTCEPSVLPFHAAAQQDSSLTSSSCSAAAETFPASVSSCSDGFLASSSVSSSSFKLEPISEILSPLRAGYVSSQGSSPPLTQQQQQQSAQSTSTQHCSLQSTGWSEHYNPNNGRSSVTSYNALPTTNHRYELLSTAPQQAPPPCGTYLNHVAPQVAPPCAGDADYVTSTNSTASPVAQREDYIVPSYVSQLSAAPPAPGAGGDFVVEGQSNQYLASRQPQPYNPHLLHYTRSKPEQIPNDQTQPSTNSFMTSAVSVSNSNDLSISSSTSQQIYSLTSHHVADSTQSNASLQQSECYSSMTSCDLQQPIAAMQAVVSGIKHEGVTSNDLEKLPTAPQSSMTSCEPLTNTDSSNADDFGRVLKSICDTTTL